MIAPPADPHRVRHAHPDDEEELMRLCRSLHDENAFLPMSEEKVRGMIHRAFNRRGGIIGVVGTHDRIEGAICLTISTMWYAEQWVLEELFNFVHPEFRRSTNAKDLIAFAKMASDELHLPLLIGIVSNLRTAAKVRMYRNQLGEPAGAFFLHGATTGEPDHVRQG